MRGGKQIPPPGPPIVGMVLQVLKQERPAHPEFAQGISQIDLTSDTHKLLRSPP